MGKKMLIGSIGYMPMALTEFSLSGKNDIIADRENAIDTV